MQFFWLLRHSRNTSAFVCQFAGYHSLLPGLFGKVVGTPLIVVASGTESVKYPSISYGNFAKPIFAFFTASTFKLASHVAVVHKSLARSENSYYVVDGRKQGFMNHVSSLNVGFTEIPYGFDSTRWVPTGTRRPNSFLTVAHVWNKVRFTLKGIDLLLDLASEFPECRFTVIGLTYTPDREVPSNVIIHESVDNDELAGIYSAHEFYLQLSISEGHPNALCEAMLCGCIPIGSTAGAIPDIIGPAGYLVAKRDFAEVKKVVKTALTDKRSELGLHARRRIETTYPFGRRRAELAGLVERFLA